VSDLRARQLWFHELVTHEGEGLEGAIAAAEARSPLGAGGGLGRVLRSGAGLSAEGGVAIYRRAYWSRLVDCLADDYPALQYAIGDDAFDALARDYAAQHPSRSPNLNAFGRHLAGFCRARPEPWAAFAAELAELEWALVEVLHAPLPPPLPPDALTALPPERWPGVRLRPSRALRLLRFAYPVDAFLQAFREGREPARPGEAPSATAVYRQGPRLWRQALTPAMADLLGALVAGQTLGEAIGALERGFAERGESADAGRAIMQWFQGWVAAGFFAALEAPGPTLRGAGARHGEEQAGRAGLGAGDGLVERGPKGAAIGVPVQHAAEHEVADREAHLGEARANQHVHRVEAGAVLLHPGRDVGADGRVIADHELAIDEDVRAAALAGEALVDADDLFDEIGGEVALLDEENDPRGRLAHAHLTPVARPTELAGRRWQLSKHGLRGCHARPPPVNAGRVGAGQVAFFAAPAPARGLRGPSPVARGLRGPESGVTGALRRPGARRGQRARGARADAGDGLVERDLKGAAIVVGVHHAAEREVADGDGHLDEARANQHVHRAEAGAVLLHPGCQVAPQGGLVAGQELAVDEHVRALAAFDRALVDADDLFDEAGGQVALLDEENDPRGRLAHAHLALVGRPAQFAGRWGQLSQHDGTHRTPFARGSTARGGGRSGAAGRTGRARASRPSGYSEGGRATRRRFGAFSVAEYLDSRAV
jgi:hypothetical protein